MAGGSERQAVAVREVPATFGRSVSIAGDERNTAVIRPAN